MKDGSEENRGKKGLEDGKKVSPNDST